MRAIRNLHIAAFAKVFAYFAFIFFHKNYYGLLDDNGHPALTHGVSPQRPHPRAYARCISLQIKFKISGLRLRIKTRIPY